MRKSRRETAETRQRIVDAAAGEFRRNGIGNTGLADLMAAAGLTHGGFYKHFSSKENLVEESIVVASGSFAETMICSLSNSTRTRALDSAISDYLSLEHRDNPGSGCPFVALGSEMARGSDELREASTAGFLKLVGIFSAHLEDRSPAAAKKEALVILATLIGAVTVARMVNDPSLSATILQQTKKHLSKRN
ncbi:MULTISPECIES: TetR/AcrR family transcriptional regulator [unclassified Caballeronia]|jgi:TetR/AcrR family transcriptional repressor of nem operon|uniref:TetR/AcrR family transcriptional regulator n=1 Tax=unclassified Caballeronia TaxID=2646786 RepID=UPI003ED0D30E